MMAIRRGRFHTPAYMSTKGHSVVSQRSYAMPSRTPLSTGVSRASSVAYDTRVEDYLLSERVSNVSYLSNSTLDMTDDTAKRSRGRDQQLLRDATQAIVSSESYATPQASVASRRVARGRSLAPRAASVPPRPLYPEVDSTLAASTTDKTSTTTTTTTATFTQASYDPQAPSRARRPIIVYAAPTQRRAMSVPPPPLVFRKEEGKPLKAPARVPPRDMDWRSRARARSVPPTLVPAPRPPRPGPRRYRAAERALMLPLRAVPLLPLPTAGLRAHKVPRRFLTRTGVRTAFGSLRGYYEEDEGKKERRELEEMARARGLTPLPTEGLRAHRVPRWFTSLRAYYGAEGPGGGRGRESEATYGIRKSVTRARVLASPLARATLARGWWRVAPPLASRPKPKPAPIHVSLSGFPKVYVPSKGPKPSNRSKAAIIASKLEPDPIKRRRPRSEFAANKYRSMRKEAQESVYAGTPHSSGLYSSVPPLSGVDQSNPPMSDLRRRIRKTLNKTRNSSVF